jgi:RNA-directed DNA polymerase
MSKTKPFIISKHLVMEAFKLVKVNQGGAGIDKQSLEEFEENLKDNLYKIWNRMSSGCYMPPEVKAVEIPKKSGGVRVLGIPTVSDRVAQMVVKLMLEPKLEPIFLDDSYGYRPRKSALDAIDVTRQRCWRFDWVLEFDIKGLFDNIDHELLMRAVDKHTDIQWIKLYIKRWLVAPININGKSISRTKGTPQGGVISPLLANLFLHYTFDVWMKRNHPYLQWCRYADDGLVHCKSEAQANYILNQLKMRFEECNLELHPTKTKIVYCKDGARKAKYENTSFDFLGYTFRARVVKNTKRGTLFINFTPAVSKSALKAMRAKTRKANFRNQSNLTLQDIARLYNPVLRGWLLYYGKFYPSALYPVLRHFNQTLVAWARRKYKKLARHKTRAGQFIENISKTQPNLFPHWQRGMIGAFA